MASFQVRALLFSESSFQTAGKLNVTDAVVCYKVVFNYLTGLANTGGLVVVLKTISSIVLSLCQYFESRLFLTLFLVVFGHCCHV